MGVLSFVDGYADIVDHCISFMAHTSEGVYFHLNFLNFFEFIIQTPTTTAKCDTWNDQLKSECLDEIYVQIIAK